MRTTVRSRIAEDIEKQKHLDCQHKRPIQAAINAFPARDCIKDQKNQPGCKIERKQPRVIRRRIEGAEKISNTVQ
jgi:hypothetical protein